MKTYIKKEELVNAIEFTTQTAKELVIELNQECSLSGNGWEKIKKLKIDGKSYDIKEGDYIILQNKTIDVLDKEVFESLFVLKEEETEDEAIAKYKAMTVPQLKEECKKRKIQNYSKLKEDELILLLIEDDNKGDSNE